MPFQPRIAILVPDAAYAERWQPYFAVIERTLGGIGMAITPRVWHDPGDLSDFDLVLPLFAWGYPEHPARWHAQVDAWEAAQLPMVNPPALLRWNSDKAYLDELAAKGVAVVPTMTTDALNDADLAAARLRFGCGALVVKPPVSAGAMGTFLLGADDGVPAAVAGARMLIQPVMAGITDPGEYSLFYFDGVFSHAVVKKPVAGDFRVQEQYGGVDVAVDPSAAARALAAAALAACPVPPIYARVDMVGDDAGRLHIIELELIEPALFLHHAPDGGAAFAAAIIAAATRAIGGSHS